MEKRKGNRTSEAQKLSAEAIARLEHFFRCCPPQYFSRSLRCLLVHWMDRNSDGLMPFHDELFGQLTLFFPVLDFLEDEGKFHSEDYAINWGHKFEHNYVMTAKKK